MSICFPRRLKLLYLMLLCCITPAALFAGVTMTMRLEHPSVLRFEKMNAFITINNDTDNLIFIDEKNFGKGTARKFEFDVYQKRYHLISRKGKKPVIPEMTLIPGDKRVFMVDLSRFYDVTKEGRYFVGAVLVGEKKNIRSKRDMIDVVRGIELASITKEIPGYEDELRKLSVRYWSRHNKEVAFLSVDDEKKATNYGVFQLGNILRVSKPSIRYKRTGRFTVLHQCRGDCYVLTDFIMDNMGVRSLAQRYVNRKGQPYNLSDARKSKIVEKLKSQQEPPEKKKKKKSFF